MSRVPPYSRYARTVRSLSPTGLSPALAARSSNLRLTSGFLTVWEPCRSPSNTVQPRWRNGGTLGTPAVWACTVSLAATPALFYFLRVREMFQFPGLPPHRLCVHRRVTRLTTSRGFPIRISSAHCPRAAPRGISLLRHVLRRHERPRHPPDALRHGYTHQRGVAPVAACPCLLFFCSLSPMPTPKTSACSLLPRLSPRLVMCTVRHFLAADEKVSLRRKRVKTIWASPRETSQSLQPACILFSLRIDHLHGLFAEHHWRGNPSVRRGKCSTYLAFGGILH